MDVAMGRATVAARFAQFIGGRIAGYGNYPDIQALWEKHENSVNPKEREDLIKQMQRLNHEKKMYIPIVRASTPNALGPGWKGNPYNIPFTWYVAPMEDIEMN